MSIVDLCFLPAVCICDMLLWIFSFCFFFYFLINFYNYIHYEQSPLVFIYFSFSIFTHWFCCGMSPILLAHIFLPLFCYKALLNFCLSLFPIFYPLCFPSISIWCFFIFHFFYCYLHHFLSYYFSWFCFCFCYYFIEFFFNFFLSFFLFFWFCFSYF